MDTEKLIDLLRGPVESDPTDYGCNDEDPESLIYAVLDNGQLGASVVRALRANGYAIVRSDALEASTRRVKRLAEALSIAGRAIDIVNETMANGGNDPSPTLLDIAEVIRTTLSQEGL